MAFFDDGDLLENLFWRNRQRGASGERVVEIVVETRRHGVEEVFVLWRDIPVVFMEDKLVGAIGRAGQRVFFKLDGGSFGGNVVLPIQMGHAAHEAAVSAVN